MLSITSFSKQNIDTDDYYNLKQKILEKVNIYDKKIELIVLDTKSILKVDGKKEGEFSFELPKDIEFFSYWKDDENKDYFEPFYEDEYFQEVLFRFYIYPNGSSTKCIIRINDRYFIQSNYFKDYAIFNDLDDAKEYLLRLDVKQSMVVSDE